jgi:hypothetical protein
MFKIPSQCNYKSNSIKFSSSDKVEKIENKVNKLGFTPSVVPYNFDNFNSSSFSEPLSSINMPKTSDPPRAIKNIPEFKKSAFITQCPPGYSPIGGLNVGSKFLNCVHNITKKQIQIICPPNYTLDSTGKCTINKNGKPNLPPKNDQPTYFEKDEFKEDYMIPKIYKDFPKNAHNSFRSSKKIILSDEE